MKKILIAVLLALNTLCLGTAHAGTCETALGNTFPWAQAQQICKVFGTTIPMSLVPSADNAIDLGTTAKSWRSAYVDTSIIFGAGASNQFAPFVPTLVATPVAGTNYFAPGLNVVPTNAANNAAFLGADPTVVPGKSFVIINASGAAQRIKAAGGATLNGATAGGYISLASLATVECYNQSATNQVCLQPVIPTPAGP